MYQELAGDRLLIPRYSPIVKQLHTQHRSSFKQLEPTERGIIDEMFVWNDKYPLKPVQVPGATEIVEVLEKQRGGIIIGDTGSGKTVVGLHTIWAIQPRRALILVDQIDIAIQWAERITQFMPGTRMEFLMQRADIKVIEQKLGIRAGEGTSRGTITIATAQSLYRSDIYTWSNPIETEMLVCDEVHVFAAQTFMRSIFKVNFGYSLGLTATPDRKDGLEWVFFQCLGKAQVDFAGQVMTPVVRRLNPPHCGFKDGEWKMAWCTQKKGMTWLAKCRDCAFYPVFPHGCGGQLKTTQTGKIAWKKINRMALISAWSCHPDYLNWCRDVIRQLMEKKRHIFVFGENRRFLLLLYQQAVKDYGHPSVGIFLGKGAPDPEEPDVSWQRHTALSKPLTFLTYGVGRKALDVCEKDCAILATPISDARQAVGRVRRRMDNKKTPMVIAPVPRIDTFLRSWEKVKQQFEERGWQIK